MNFFARCGNSEADSKVWMKIEKRKDCKVECALTKSLQAFTGEIKNPVRP